MSRLSARLAKAETIVQRLHGGFDIVVVGQHENEAQAIEREGSSDPRYRLIINTWPPPEPENLAPEQQIERIFKELEAHGYTRAQIEDLIANQTTDS